MNSRSYLGKLAVILIALTSLFGRTAAAQGVTLSRTSVNFGAHVVGKSSVALTVFLLNSSTTTPLSLGSIAASGEFSESDDCNGYLAVSGGCTLSITFSPNSAAPAAGVVTIHDDAADSPQFISLAGTGIAPVIVSPASLAFGTLAVGKTSAAKTVTVTNQLTGAVAVGFTASTDYLVSGAGTTPCKSSLAAKSSCTLAVKFAPTIAGTITGALTLTQSVNSIPQLIPLSGTGNGGSTPPLFTPTLEAFGAVALGANSEKTVVVTNTSSAAVSISAITGSGDYTASGGGSSPCGGPLQPKGQCSIAIFFAPTALGIIKGTVGITDNASVSTQTFNLSGTGVIALKVSPASLTFPVQQQGTSSTPQAVTVTNQSQSAMPITISISGDYSQTNNCGASMNPAASCRISVVSAPLGRTGVISGALTIVSSGPSSPQVVALSGQSTGSLPRFAYAVNSGDGTVSMYTADVHGQLRSNSYIGAGTTPVAIAVAPSNNFAYVIDADNNNLSTFSIDSATGRLALTGPVLGTGNIPTAIAMTATGTLLYVSNDDGTVSGYKVNIPSGILSNVSGSPFPAGSSPVSITLTPNGEFAYVANLADSTVSAYAVNASTGVLTPIAGSPFTTGEFPWDVIVEPSGNFVYVANLGGTVSAFKITASTGALVQITSSPYAAGSNPEGLAVDRSGRFLYVVNAGSGDISAYTITPGTGALAAIPGSPFLQGGNPVAATVDPTNRFLYVTDEALNNISTYSINPVSGALTLQKVAPARNNTRLLAVSSGPTPLTYVPKFAYTPAFGGTGVADGYTIDGENGGLTLIPGSPFSPAVASFWVAEDPFGRFLYADGAVSGNSGTAGIIANTIDPITGALTAGSTTAPLSYSASAMAVDPSGRFAYVVGPCNCGTGAGSYPIYGFNIEYSGALAPIAGSPFSIGFEAPVTSWNSLAIDPSGRFLYQIGDQGFATPAAILAFTINSSNGALTPVPGSPFASSSSLLGTVALDPSGRFLYVINYPDTISAYAIDTSANPSKGSLTAVPGSPFPVTASPVALTVDPTGKFLYAVGKDHLSAYTLNVTNGALTVVAHSPFATGEGPLSVTADPSGNFLFVPNEGVTAKSIYVYHISPTTGALAMEPESPILVNNVPEPMTVTGIFH